MNLDVAGGPASAHLAVGAARIRTLVGNTGQRDRTIWVDGAFWLALDIRVALQSRQTRARRRTGSLAALGVDAARRGSAGVNWSWCGG